MPVSLGYDDVFADILIDDIYCTCAKQSMRHDICYNTPAKAQAMKRKQSTTINSLKGEKDGECRPKE